MTCHAFISSCERQTVYAKKTEFRVMASRVSRVNVTIRGLKVRVSVTVSYISGVSATSNLIQLSHHCRNPFLPSSRLP